MIGMTTTTSRPPTPARRVLVIGASRGLGLALADEWLRGGRHVTATVRSSGRTGLHDLADRYDIRPRDPGSLIGQLSGGNQQKAVLGKWIETAPRILLLHEPTQGVDVGARQHIFRIIRATAERCSVLVASSDHDQLAELCDRVLIVRKGRIVTQLARSELTKSRITAECLRPSLEQV